MDLKRVFGHILRLTAAVIALTAGHAFSAAQQLRLPERWRIDSGPAPELFIRDTLTICVIGDVMMHSLQIEDALQKDSTYRFRCFDLIRDSLASADLAIANMEFTLAGQPYAGYPRFSAPDSFAEYLADCGLDIFLTANNHILDRGSKGMARTLEIYERLEESHGVKFTGSGIDAEDEPARNPLVIRKNGFSIAFMNMTYGTNLGKTEIWPSVNYLGAKNSISAMFGRAEEKGAELTAVFPHWGNEYELQHSMAQENTALWLADNGADIIIGAHPHVAQDFGTVGSGNVQVAYSLGNAVSNMSAANTQIQLMATIKAVRDNYGKAVFLPVSFTYLWCSRPGGYTNTYMVLPVKEFIGTRDEWIGRWEYDKMLETYYRVIEETGIKDN